MGKLTVKSLAKRIEENNQIFENSTRTQKRVIIAQDCLDRIKLGQIEPSGGAFCNLSSDLEYSDESVKNLLNSSKRFICFACAKGSLFMSYIGRVNKTNFNQIESDNSINDRDHSKLLEIFSLRQLALIEYVFEGWQPILYDKQGNLIDFDESKVADFRFRVLRKKRNSQEALIKAICENIIQNKGTFKI